MTLDIYRVESPDPVDVVIPVPPLPEPTDDEILVHEIQDRRSTREVNPFDLAQTRTDPTAWEGSE